MTASRNTNRKDFWDGLLLGIIGVLCAIAIVSIACNTEAKSTHEPTVIISPNPQVTPTSNPTRTATPTVTPAPTPTPSPTPSPTPIPPTPKPAPVLNMVPTPIPTPISLVVSPAPSDVSLPSTQISPEEHWIYVDLSDLTATAMVGNTPVYTALVTSGKPGWETSIGDFRIFSRIYDETMTNGLPGDPDYYYLENVLFTQYFNIKEEQGLHYNYWSPDYVFGQERRSHGCIGMRYEDAEFFWNFANLDTLVVVRQ